MKVRYTVVNIFRMSDLNKTFVMCLYSDKLEFFRVDKSLTETISKGMVYIGDSVIIKETTPDGIIFENEALFDSQSSAPALTDVDFFYSDTKKVINPVENPNTHYLPYLCDVLPYNSAPVTEANAKPVFKNEMFIGKYLVNQIEVSNIKMPLPQSFIGKIVQKTRINLYPTSYNPFFFAIVSSNDIFIKVVFWMESLKSYSSLKVGDIVMVKDYKMKKKWSAFDKIDLNTFTESIYFDVEEITAKDLLKIKYDKKTQTPSLFETVEGTVEYLSIIMRTNINGTFMEYVLMHVDGQKVVLFYNSDFEFYKIQPKTRIRINELRKIERAGEEMYVSTIYTQFELFYGDSDADKQVFTQECDLDTEDLVTQRQKRLKVDIEPINPVFGALGFIPDSFDKISDILEYQRKETINGVEASFNLFMKPVITTTSEIQKQTLVLNEVKKFVLTTKIIAITDVECVISYFEGEETKKQGSFQLILEDQFKIFVYENFFIENCSQFKLLESPEASKNIIGKEVCLVIEAFRADDKNIIYYLTGIMKNV